MYTILLVCHFIIAILMVISVLVQSGKGGGLGAGFGGSGGSNTLFGSSGGIDFFAKFTMALAAAFAVTSISLTVIKSHALKSSIFDQGKAPSANSAPVTPATAPAPAKPADAQ